MATQTRKTSTLSAGSKPKNRAPEPQRTFGEPIKNVEPGVYRHFSGELFSVVSTGLDVVTQQECVVYKSLSVVERVYIAPLNTFLGAVAVPGRREVPRFERIEEAELQSQAS